MAIENDLTEICFLGGLIFGNWEWEGHVFSPINKNLSSLSSSPFPKKSEREKGPNPPLSSPSPGRASNPHFLRKRTLPQHSAAHLSVFSVLSLVGDPSLEMPKKLQREIYLGGRCCRGSPKQSEDFNELNSKRNTEEGPFGY